MSFFTYSHRVRCAYCSFLTKPPFRYHALQLKRAQRINEHIISIGLVYVPDNLGYIRSGRPPVLEGISYTMRCLSHHPRQSFSLLAWLQLWLFPQRSLCNRCRWLAETTAEFALKLKHSFPQSQYIEYHRGQLIVYEWAADFDAIPM